MVLKFEQRNFGEAGPLEVIRLNLGPSGLHIEQLLILRNKVQDLLAGLTQDSIVTTTDTVSTCLRFFLKHRQDSHSLKEMNLPKMGSSLPIYLQLHLRPDPKQQVEEDLEKASAILKLDELSEGNSFRLLFELFSFTLEHHLELGDFLENSRKDPEPPPPPLLSRQCGVCGTEASENFCSSCVIFFQTSQPTEVESWECQDQAGYCSIIDTFQFKQNQLIFTSNDGKTLQYVTNRNVLCKLCRYKRCKTMGMTKSPAVEIPADHLEEVDDLQERNGKKRTSVDQEEGEGSCIVCRSTLGVNLLGICSPCQMFLSDSVEESSQDTISCMRGSDCQVTASKTVAFAACTGCWMERMKQLGILKAFQSQLSQKEQPCSVCSRQGGQMYQSQTCCTQCKNFFLRCAKSKCFKDFVCSGDCLGIGVCPACWWKRCVQVGLYSVYKGYGPVLETKGPNSTTVANVSTLLNGKTVKIN